MNVVREDIGMFRSFHEADNPFVSPVVRKSVENSHATYVPFLSGFVSGSWFVFGSVPVRFKFGPTPILLLIKFVFCVLVRFRLGVC